MFQNEKIGEFLYYLDGTPILPEPCKVLVDEAFLDTTRIKYIKSNRPDNKTLIFRCFSGDKIDIKLLVPVCNLERENALVMASEMVISSKSAINSNF